MKKDEMILSAISIPVIKHRPPVTSPALATFEVTSDSVVVTATIKVSTGTKEFIIDWEDGTTTRVRHGISPAIIHYGNISILPDGTYEIKHVYEAPEDKLPFEKLIFIKEVDQNNNTDFKIKRITITPRYRVTNYSIYFRLIGSSDWPSNDDELLFTSYKHENDVTTTKQWKFTLSNSITPSEWYKLEDSIISKDLVAGEILRCSLSVVEEDDLSGDDDILGVMLIGRNLDPLNESGPVESNSGGVIELRWDREVKLLIPNAHSTPPVIRR